MLLNDQQNKKQVFIYMEEIRFRASKSKFKAFEEKEEKPKVKKEKPVKEIKKPRNIFRRRKIKNAASVWNAAKSVLNEKYNIDSLSVYVITEKNGKMNYDRVFGTEIIVCELEKYCGFDSPVILTNADGFADEKTHRARLIEVYGDYTVIAAGTNFETFKFDSCSIRNIIRKAYKEVEKLR